MAHKGQLAPNLLRRDFNTNVETNNEGWSRRCIVHWDDLGTGLAAFWSKSTWDCGPDSYPAIDRALWKSDVVLKFGIHWWTEFEITITPTSGARRRIRLQTQEQGIGLEITYALTLTPAYGPTLTTDRAITFWSTSLFDQFPVGALESTFRPKLYRDGPPE